MIFRFKIETFARNDDDAVDERLRELGLESWELVSFLPGSREDPNDNSSYTGFFKKDASTDIGL